MTAHALSSPSGAYRWARCTASVMAIEAAGLPDESSDAADEGTAAHQIREECLALGLPASAFVGTTVRVNGKDWEVTEEMADYLQPGIDWIEERVDPTLMELLVEERVSIEPYLPGQFGTLDAAFAYRTEDGIVLTLSDLKYGRIDVDPHENWQQMIYALGLRERADELGIADIIEIVIDQPRKGGLKVWRTTPERLLEFGDWIAERGAEALSDAGVFRPSEKACHFCPLADTYEARAQWLAEMLDAAFDMDDEPPAPRVMDLETRARVVRHAGLLKKFLDRLAAEARDDLLAGETVPGLKLVLGKRGDREWGDVAKATSLLTKALGADAYAQPPPVLIGPPTAEKRLKKTPAWADLKALITQTPGAPIMVPEEDSRPAYRSVDDEFEEME